MEKGICVGKFTSKKNENKLSVSPGTGGLGFPFSFRGSVLLQVILWRNVLQKKFARGSPSKTLQNERALSPATPAE